MTKAEFAEFMAWAKEQTMIKETIYRKDAIEALHEEWDGGWLEVTGEWIADNCEAVLNKLPSADRPSDPHNITYINALKNRIRELEAKRPQGWIPCSERLPERLERVLVTRTNGRVEETFKWDSEEYPWNGGYDDVLAWMPLPKPWKGADDEVD